MSVIDTASAELIKAIRVGTHPSAMAVNPERDELYVANTDSDSISVINMERDRVEGLIPTAWYPTGVAISPDGKGHYVVNAKGLGAGPNPGGPVPTEDPESPPNQYIGSMIDGTLSTISVPGEEKLADYTEQVAGNNDFDHGTQ